MAEAAGNGILFTHKAEIYATAAIRFHKGFSWNRKFFGVSWIYFPPNFF